MAEGKSISQMRRDAFAIFQAALNAVNPETLVHNAIALNGDNLLVDGSAYSIKEINRIFVLGAGKASVRMAKALESLLGSFITDGAIITKYGYFEPLKKIEVIEAGHPLPDEAGLKGSKKIIDLATKAEESDLILFLISGGGSALFIQPCPGISLENKRKLTSLLLSCGATIHEINAIRKHISQIKGGKFARLIYPATAINLILSDVIGDDPSIIASGPMAPDSSTFAECWSILEKYGITEKIPSSIIRHLQKGLKGQAKETARQGEASLKKVKIIIIGNNRLAIKEAEKKAESLGYKSIILSSFISGEAREAARFHCAIAKEILSSGNPVAPPACVISGGEVTVTLRGNGKGGRSQELALAAALEMSNWKNIVAFCAGTDGTDGPTEAAGAIADNHSIKNAMEKGLDANEYLANNNSYHFFQQLNDLIITNPTYTNVMDLYLFLIAKAKQ